METISKSASACRSVLLHSTNIPAVASLTDTVGPEGSAKAGTFTPPGAGAALSCNIPELVRCLIKLHLSSFTWREHGPFPTCVKEDRVHCGHQNF